MTCRGARDGVLDRKGRGFVEVCGRFVQEEQGGAGLDAGQPAGQGHPAEFARAQLGRVLIGQVACGGPVKAVPGYPDHGRRFPAGLRLVGLVGPCLIIGPAWASTAPR